MKSFAEYNLAYRFLTRASAGPDRAALRIDGAQFSYGDLACRAGRIATWLLGVIDRPGARVGILARRTVDAYAGVLGACMAGAAYVPINVELPIERQLAIIRRSRLSAIVADRPFDARIAAAADVQILGRSEIAALRVRPLTEVQPMPPDTPAYLMFTSGTIETPKAVIVTAGNVAHYLRVARERCPIYPDDRVSQFYDLPFDASVFDIFHGLGSGACLHVVPAIQRMAPARFIREEGLTVWSSVPSVISILQRLKMLSPGAFPSLRLAMFCGEALLASHVEAWRIAAPTCVLENQYGPAETTVNCFGEQVSDPPRVTPSRGVVAIGSPFPDMHAGIVDDRGVFLPPGKPGELAVSGPQIAAGYFDEPELTRRRFRTLNHPTLGRALFYLTGDLAYQDPDGCFHHLGRVDHQVKILGRRVELEEIECHLRALNGGEAVVVAWPVEDGTAHGVVAFVAGGERSTASLQEALIHRLPSYMVPRRIFRRDTIPFTPNGKLDRIALLRELERMPNATAP